MGKDEFLKLFITQLRNQDPTNPMDGQQLAAQLAQFTSVEQLININAQLEGQIGELQGLGAATTAGHALSMIGRTVVAESDQVAVGEGGSGAATIHVGAGGGSATLRIYDADGNEVGSRSLGELEPGRQTVELGAAAQGLAPGAYRYKVEVTDAAGEAVPVRTYAVGIVDGVRSGLGSPLLTMGPLEIPVLAVVEGSTPK
jgi:flagellar basal-body rod modification protein FlgD